MDDLSSLPPGGIQLRLLAATEPQREPQREVLEATDLHHFALMVLFVVDHLSHTDRARVLKRALELIDGP